MAPNRRQTAVAHDIIGAERALNVVVAAIMSLRRNRAVDRA
jgi:hypothetical protein